MLRGKKYTLLTWGRLNWQDKFITIYLFLISYLIFITGGSGRYKVIIPNEQLQTLYDLKFTAPQMAEKFGCSEPLIYKRLQEAGLKLRDRYSNISDADLDAKVSGLQSKFPNAGSVVSYNTFFIPILKNIYGLLGI